MRKVLFLIVGIFIMVCQVQAALISSISGNGAATITLQNSGDLAAGYSGLPDGVKNATKLIVVTTGGAELNKSDMETLCGQYDSDNTHFKRMTELDLSGADVYGDNNVNAWDNGLQYLHWLDNLKKITFPANATEIPQSCLIDASSNNVEEVIIPDNPARGINIGLRAFAGLKKLKKIVFGSVTSGTIGLQCFENCTGLRDVDFHPGWQKIGNNCFFGCTAIDDILLPEGLKVIDDGAFSGSAIRTIRLPGTLEEIHKNAFRCHNLKSITIPKSVKYIENEAFQECYNLTDVYVLGSDTKAENQAFQAAVPYGYQYKGPGQGEQVTREQYVIKNTPWKARTVLHYPAAAKDKYMNDYVKVIGTSEFASKFPNNSEMNRWVIGENGEKWPVNDFGMFNGQAVAGNYAGWKNFMLTGELKDKDIWEDKIHVKDKWYTMCLPFDMTEEQLKSAYGSEVEVVEFSGVTVKKLEDRSKRITLQFKRPVTATKAHHPYMIHPSIHAGTQTGVIATIVGIQKQSETDPGLLENEKVVIEADGVKYTFIGNYTQGKGIPQYTYYYYSGDESVAPNAYYKWVDPTGGTWTPYAACILLDKDNGAKAKPDMSFFKNGSDDVVTEIEILPAESVQTQNQVLRLDNKVRNLSGQVVGTDASALNSLPKGIYLVRGKKYIVR
ncbi:MAG: leucine-rich repeat domain-containing protein [Prevotella sp.]|nr:leucine-rich repeat domain-containing protein [Prevotella sp.]